MAVQRKENKFHCVVKYETADIAGFGTKLLIVFWFSGQAVRGIGLVECAWQCDEERVVCPLGQIRSNINCVDRCSLINYERPLCRGRLILSEVVRSI